MINDSNQECFVKMIGRRGRSHWKGGVDNTYKLISGDISKNRGLRIESEDSTGVHREPVF